MHWICAWCKGFAFDTSVRRSASGLAVDNVGSDGENRESRSSITVNRLLGKLLVEASCDLDGQRINSIVIVAKHGDIQVWIHALESHSQAFFVPNGNNIVILHGGKRIRQHRKAGNAKSHESIDFTVVEGHLHGLVVGMVVGIVDAIHGVSVELGHPRNSNVEKDLFELVIVNGSSLSFIANACFGTSFLNNRRHQLSMRFIAAAIEAHQQELDAVGSCSKELHVNADSHP
mmetsp:Transcript_4067/g.8344  ORF Transcript_4067/g.8344 Transcript_4067/m.8344 type:complete len:231 (-) Transcript_4067:888-1580(-)